MSTASVTAAARSNGAGSSSPTDDSRIDLDDAGKLITGNSSQMRTALTIAGSDSSGGAGIQADLKTFAAHGVFGCSAITAVTAQNPLGVGAVAVLDPSIVVAQIDTVLADLEIHATKIGLLASEPI